MAKATRNSVEAVNAAANAKATLLNNGYLRIFAGAVPDTADEALAGQTLLSEHRFADPAFGAAADGVITAHALTVNLSTEGTGPATFYRALKADGASPVLQGTVGTANANLVMAEVDIEAGGQLTITSFTHTEHTETSGY